MKKKILIAINKIKGRITKIAKIEILVTCNVLD